MTYVNPENLTGIVEMVQYVNTTTEGYFGPLILAVIMLVVFINAKETGTAGKFIILKLSNT